VPGLGVHVDGPGAAGKLVAEIVVLVELPALAEREPAARGCLFCKLRLKNVVVLLEYAEVAEEPIVQPLVVLFEEATGGEIGVKGAQRTFHPELGIRLLNRRAVRSLNGFRRAEHRSAQVTHHLRVGQCKVHGLLQ